MKKIIFAVTVLVYSLLISITSQAQEGINVPQAVKETFTGQFKNSTFERWVKLHDMYIATFKEGNTWRDAYFTEEGEFKGIGKFVATDALPMFAAQSIKEKYPDYGVFELYQYECQENGLCFYAVLKDAKHQVILKLDTNGDVAYSQKTKLKGAPTVNNDIASAKINP
jgi:hypothetical protein